MEKEVYALLTPDISANEYIIELNVSVLQGQDVGIIFKSKDTNTKFLQVVYYINVFENEVAVWHYVDEDEDWDHVFKATSPINLQ